MNAFVENSVHELFARAGLAPSEPCGGVRLATAILGRSCIQIVPHRALPGNSALEWNGTKSVIRVRDGLNARQLNHAAAHELGEWHLRLREYERADCEDIARAIAAAVCVPRSAFREARRVLGEGIPELSRAFVVSESLMALRIAECTGLPTALITRRRVRTRGPAREWPTTREGWNELLERAHSSGLVLHRIRDARGRFVLRAPQARRVR
jgi:hypothetical protein